MEVFEVIKKYMKQIERRKAILNFLLKYLSINNRLILYISQDLDNIVNKAQKNMYRKHVNRIFNKNYTKKVA